MLICFLYRLNKQRLYIIITITIIALMSACRVRRTSGDHGTE